MSELKYAGRRKSETSTRFMFSPAPEDVSMQFPWEQGLGRTPLDYTSRWKFDDQMLFDEDGADFLVDDPYATPATVRKPTWVLPSPTPTLTTRSFVEDLTISQLTPRKSAPSSSRRAKTPATRAHVLDTVNEESYYHPQDEPKQTNQKQKRRSSALGLDLTNIFTNRQDEPPSLRMEVNIPEYQENSQRTLENRKPAVAKRKSIPKPIPPMSKASPGKPRKSHNAHIASDSVPIEDPDQSIVAKLTSYGEKLMSMSFLAPANGTTTLQNNPPAPLRSVEPLRLSDLSPQKQEKVSQLPVIGKQKRPSDAPKTLTSILKRPTAIPTGQNVSKTVMKAKIMTEGEHKAMKPIQSVKPRTPVRVTPSKATAPARVKPILRPETRVKIASNVVPNQPPLQVEHGRGTPRRKNLKRSMDDTPKEERERPSKRIRRDLQDQGSQDVPNPRLQPRFNLNPESKIIQKPHAPELLTETHVASFDVNIHEHIAVPVDREYGGLRRINRSPINFRGGRGDGEDVFGAVKEVSMTVPLASHVEFEREDEEEEEEPIEYNSPAYANPQNYREPPEPIAHKPPPIGFIMNNKRAMEPCRLTIPNSPKFMQVHREREVEKAAGVRAREEYERQMALQKQHRRPPTTAPVAAAVLQKIVQSKAKATAPKEFPFQTDTRSGLGTAENREQFEVRRGLWEQRSLQSSSSSSSNNNQDTRSSVQPSLVRKQPISRPIRGLNAPTLSSARRAEERQKLYSEKTENEKLIQHGRMRRDRESAAERLEREKRSERRKPEQVVKKVPNWFKEVPVRARLN